MPSNFSRGPLRSTQKNKRKNTHAHIKITGHGGGGACTCDKGGERETKERKGKGEQRMTNSKIFFPKNNGLCLQNSGFQKVNLSITQQSNKEANRKNN